MTTRRAPGVQPLRSVQIAVGALATGVLGFAVIAVVMRMESSDPELGRTLLLVLAAMPVGMVPGYLVMRRRYLSQLARRRADAKDEIRARRVPHELFMLTIMGAAMIEGVGMFGGVIVLLGGEMAVIAIPVIATLLISFLMPTKQRIETAVSNAARE